MMIQGVLGPIDTAELGQTLMHEHITCADWSMRMNFGTRFFEFDQVAEIAAGQLGKAKALGVCTVVDGTPVNLGRDIRLIREVARRTGLNFIASTGFYYQEEPWLYFRDEEEIYDLLMGDCADGISGTGSKPGILKAGVGRGGLTPLLQKVLHATGRVAKETGLPLFCHHDPSTAAGGAILDLLAAYLAFWDSWETTKHSDWLHLEEDYTFIHRRVLPLLEERGLSRADIDRLLTGNPRAFFEGV